MCSIMHIVYRYNGMDFADFSCKGLFPRSMTGATDEIIIRDKILFKVYCEKTKKFIETDFATVIEKDVIENARSIAVKLIRKREDDYNIKDCKDCKIDNCIKFYNFRLNSYYIKDLLICINAFYYREQPYMSMKC